MGLAKTIVLKTTMDCNLRCRYCYEFGRNGDAYAGRQIRIEQLESLIERTARLFPDSRILWMLHGGEPMLNGAAYLRRMADCIRRVNAEAGVRFEIALQTNATLLTDAWIQALEDNADLLSERIVSVSIDGPREINDMTRVTRQGGSSYQMTMDAIERVRNSALTFTTISVVGSHNVDRPEEVYRFIRDLRPNFSKFIPCYNFDSAGRPERYGIDPMQYAAFMCRIFDLWLHDLPGHEPGDWFVIDPIATIVSVLTGTFVSWCEYREEKCDNFTSLYPDGGLWLCDTFDHDDTNMRDAAYLGNVFELSDEDLTRAFLQPCQVCSYPAFYRRNTEGCSACEVQRFCHGGCVASRAGLSARSERLADSHCQAKRMLINHIQRGVSLALSQSQANL